MALSEKDLERQLTEAGKQLLSPPSSAYKLVEALDRVEILLTRVEQSPSDSMKKALSPSMEALVSNELLRHSNVDVNVSVASCISEITRITAPDAPYGDEQMKEVFQLIVSSFENLYDRSSPSYQKRATILETVAKVRSCVVMLDLECDALIAEMFQHFFKSIRNEHPENVFSSMETIMTLVLEESEDVSVELLSSILDVLKSDNKEVLPVARLLGEKVTEKCADKLKPYLLPAIKSRGTTIGDYTKVVANVLQVGSEAVEPSDVDAASKNVADESDVANAPSEKAVEVALETLDDAPPSEDVGLAVIGSPKTVVSNGAVQKEVEDTSVGDDNSKEENNAAHDEASEPSKTKVDNSDAEELTKLKTKREKSSKRKGRKTNSAKSSVEPSKPTFVDEKEGKKTPDPEEIVGKDVDNAQSEAYVADSVEPAENKKEPAEIKKEPAENKKEPTENKKEAAENKKEAAENKKAAAENKKEAAEDAKEAAEDKKEPEPAEDKNEPEAAGDKEEPEPAGDKKEPEPAEDKKEPEPAADKKEPEPGEDKKEPEPVEDKKETGAPVPSPKTSDEPADVPSPSHSGSLADETRLIKAGQGKKKDETVESVPADVDLKESDTKKPSEGSIPESKSHKRKGKKVSSVVDKEDTVPSSADASKKKDEKTSELDAKSAKQSGKKVEQSVSQRDKKKKGQGKGTPTKDLAKTPAKDEGKKPTGSAKSTAKSAKIESDVEKASKSSSKRKRASESNKTSKYREEVVGSKVKVWWPDDNKFYEGVIELFDPATGKHKVLYNDGDVEILKLEDEKWKLIEYGSAPDQGHSSDSESPDESTQTPKAKKAKTSPVQGAKRGKTETSTKKAGASSSKSKATPKSQTKQKDDNKMDSQAKDETLRSIAKSDDDKSGKTKSKSGNKTSDSTSKSVGKSKDKNDLETSKGSNKAKQETPKSAPKSKAKTPKSGSKSNTNSSNKAKSTVSAMEEDTEDVKSSPEPAPEISKVKSQSASKSKKSSKKRKRSTKG